MGFPWASHGMPTERPWNAHGTGRFAETSGNVGPRRGPQAVPVALVFATGFARRVLCFFFVCFPPSFFKVHLVRLLSMVVKYHAYISTCVFGVLLLLLVSRLLFVSSSSWANLGRRPRPALVAGTSDQTWDPLSCAAKKRRNAHT